MICPSFIPFVPSQIVEFSVPKRFFVGEISSNSLRKTRKKTVLLTYHLVMTFTVRHGKVHHAIKNGKPSISIRAMENTMAM
jgi:hypothetical protein